MCICMYCCRHIVAIGEEKSNGWDLKVDVSRSRATLIYSFYTVFFFFFVLYINFNNLFKELLKGTNLKYNLQLLRMTALGIPVPGFDT